MIRFTLLILILFSLLTGSCSSRKKKLEHSGIIPEKELIALLTDIHITDGLLTLPQIHNWFLTLDSLSSYYQTIENYGYSKETMDMTMKYYFIKKPKKLIKIYDRVLGILSEMESYLEIESAKAAESRFNQWPGMTSYYLPDPFGTDETQFDKILSIPGVYTLTFSATLFPVDQAVNPRITAYLCHPDSIDTGRRDYVETINYIKDGRPHKYNLIFKIPVKTTLHLRGWLYDFDNLPDKMEKHAIFENISLSFTTAVV